MAGKTQEFWVIHFLHQYILLYVLISCWVIATTLVRVLILHGRLRGKWERRSSTLCVVFFILLSVTLRIKLQQVFVTIITSKLFSSNPFGRTP